MAWAEDDYGPDLRPAAAKALDPASPYYSPALDTALSALNASQHAMNAASDKRLLDDMKKRRSELLASEAELAAQRSMLAVQQIGVDNDLKAARDRKLALDAALLEVRGQLGQIEATEATLRDAQSRDFERLARDDATFWFRRWMTSLAVGNGAAFFVIATGLLQSNKFELAIVLAKAPLSYFGMGLMLAGVLPFLVWSVRALRESSVRAAGRKWPAVLSVACSAAVGFASIMSAGCFGCGVTSAVYEVWQFEPVAARIAREQVRQQAETTAQAEKARAVAARKATAPVLVSAPASTAHRDPHR